MTRPESNAGGNANADASPSAAARHRRRLAAVLAITLAIVAAEVIGGIIAHSLALLADAGHTGADAAGIGLSLLAIWLAARPATADRTFGSYRLEILAAVLNAVLLFGVAAFVVVEGIRRLVSPPEVAGGVMIAFACVGIGGNAASLILLRSGQSQSLNARAAFLEAWSDLLGAAAVLVAAIVVVATGFGRADAVASIVIGWLILPRTWRLLRSAVDVLLEATPSGIDMGVVRGHILETAGVADVHDLHAWTITSGMNVLSAHVVLADGADGAAVLEGLGACLADHFDIEHSTFQLEPAMHRDRERGMHT
ncbi:MAG TPA: cation diffusion facilitator family transporter [Actinomycetota bacterium]